VEGRGNECDEKLDEWNRKERRWLLGWVGLKATEITKITMKSFFMYQEDLAC